MSGEEALITTISPRRGWAPIGIRELWEHRELLYFLVLRDLKVRYKQTVFGALWALIQPLGLVLVFALFLSRVPGIAPNGVPYPLFAFLALAPWTLFSQIVLASSLSLVNASNLLQKVYFPRLLLPVAAAGPLLVDFVLAMAFLLLAMAWYGFIPGLAALWILPLTGLVVLAGLAFGIWLSALNVRYRDVRYAAPFLVQLWLFASPVAYSSALVPAEWRALYQLNPMVGLIDGFRWALVGGTEAPVAALATSVVVIAIVLVAGLVYFRRVERTFADVI